MDNRPAVIADFLHHAGWGEAARGRLAGDASFRRYDRLEAATGRAVLMDAPPPKEDVRPFIAIARHLLDLGFSAPRILAADEERGLLLLEDLGDDTYTRLLARGGDEAALYALAVDVLAALNARADAIPCDCPAYDDERLLAEALLLTEWYAPAALGEALPDTAIQAYAEAWKSLFPIARRMPETLVLRDFHVDNLLLLPRDGLEACGLLDFQDAVAGPLTYDLMSLLEDARRDIDPALVSAMRERYLAALPHLDRQAFTASWAVLAAQRHAKVIGIFTRLHRRDGKPQYLGHIPRVWKLFERALEHPALAAMKAWADTHLPPEHRRIP
ncbi:MAG: phosphotransferase [Rhodospirillales bacterium]|nr:phosphotransferase [Rhodospirillales bacterium]